MRTQATNKMASVEAVGQNLVEYKQCRSRIFLDNRIGKPEEIFVIEDVGVVDNRLIGHFLVREAYNLIKHRERVAQPTIRLLGNDVQPVAIIRHAFLVRNSRQRSDEHTSEL